MINRRTFMAGAAALAATPHLVLAQQPRPTLRLVVASAADTLEQMTPEGPGYWQAFYIELERLGFKEGVEIEIFRITGHGRSSGFDRVAADIINLRPDVVFGGGTRGMRALQAAGATMPVVGWTGDPLSNGFVKNLARPEANFTGFSVDPGREFWGKHVQFIRDLLPDAQRLAFVTTRNFVEPLSPATEAVRVAAQQFGFTYIEVVLDRPIDDAGYERAFAIMANEGAEAAYFSPAGDNRVFAPIIARLALAARLPTITSHRQIPDNGGLISYGLDRAEGYRRAAGYVAKILNGEKIANLPYQQPEIFEFVINLKTARALGLTIPPALLIRATEFVE